MKKYTCLTLLLSLLVLTTQAQHISPDVQTAYTKYARLLMYISSYYVDTTNIAKLTDKAIINTLQNLDPHSTYLTADEVKAANEPLEGNFEGIGVEFSILNDTLTVAAPIVGGPSESVGIRAGDRIVKVDDKHIAGIGLTNDQVFKLLRGPKGTKVLLTILRKNISDSLVFTVVRDKIPIHSLEAAYEAQPGLAYIRLGRFSLTSLNEIKTALAKFKTTPTAMILDLRGNSGGVLKTSIDLSEQFLPEGALLVYNEGEHFPKTMEIAGKDGFFKKGKLVLLIDEGSASASEIVSGAIQDWDRGILIGRRTFGKGLVQQLMPLTDGSQIRLTVARYHTPTGRVIQRPYDAGKIDKYYADLYKRYSNGEVYSRDSIHFPDSLKYHTLKNQRIVYGGGGIMPDIFMPVDTTSYSEYYRRLNRAGLLSQFVTSHVDKERDNLKSAYKTFADFDKKYSVSDKLFEEFVAYAETQKVPRDEKGLERSGSDIRLQLKALLARSLWSTSEYFETVNKNRDKEFQKAVEVINNWNRYEREYLY